MCWAKHLILETVFVADKITNLVRCRKHCIDLIYFLCSDTLKNGTINLRYERRIANFWSFTRVQKSIITQEKLKSPTQPLRRAHIKKNWSESLSLQVSISADCQEGYRFLDSTGSAKHHWKWFHQNHLYIFTRVILRSDVLQAACWNKRYFFIQLIAIIFSSICKHTIIFRSWRFRSAIFFKNNLWYFH